MVRWPIRYAVAILTLVALYFVLFGRQKEPVAEPTLTPDDARQALLRMLQHADETQGSRFTGLFEYAANWPFKEHADGTHSLGRFHIEVDRKLFRITFVFEDHHEFYHGKFRFKDGQWEAEAGIAGYACKLNRPEPVNDQRP